MTCDEARELARNTLSEHRFYHTECVAAAAVELAKQYGCDVQKAELAALLHDILKERSDDDLLQMLKGSDIIDFAQIERCPALWHSFAGGIYVEKELGCSREIADAVRYHTAGRCAMTLLEKVVFLADYISADRDFRGAVEVREIAARSLDEACLAALHNCIIHLTKQYRYVNVGSVEAYNCLLPTEGENG